MSSIRISCNIENQGEINPGETFMVQFIIFNTTEDIVFSNMNLSVSGTEYATPTKGAQITVAVNGQLTPNGSISSQPVEFLAIKAHLVTKDTSTTPGPGGPKVVIPRTTISDSVTPEPFALVNLTAQVSLGATTSFDIEPVGYPKVVFGRPL